MSCAMLFDVIKFVLRYFLGFLMGFYLFALIVIHFDKIRGLERLKMRLWKIYARAHVYRCACVCIYIYIYSITMCF